MCRDRTNTDTAGGERVGSNMEDKDFVLCTCEVFGAVEFFALTTGVATILQQEIGFLLRDACCNIILDRKEGRNERIDWRQLCLFVYGMIQLFLSFFLTQCLF